MVKILKNLGVVSVIGLVGTLLNPVLADGYPKKDISMIVPWSAGGGSDTIARSLVRDAKSCLGASVNIVNRTGAVGASGMGAVSRARPDGYTIGLVTFNLSTYKPMGLAQLSYRDYDLIQMVNRSPAAITVPVDSKWTTLKELIDDAKSGSNITMGHAGAGGAWHLAVSSVAEKTGSTFNYIPFDGSSKVRTALLGSHINAATSGIDEMLELYKAGKVRVLAVVSSERHPLFKDVPTIAEAGFDIGAPIYDWRGIAAPKGLPDDVKQKLTAGLKECFDSSSFKEFAKAKGLPLFYLDGNDFGTFLADMETKLVPALESAGLYRK